MDYTFNNMTRVPEDQTRINASNIKYGNYVLDNPLVAHTQKDSVLLFASQQYLIPRFSVTGNASDQFIDADIAMKKYESTDVPQSQPFFRLGSTTPFLAGGSFLTDNESKLLMGTPTFRNKVEEPTREMEVPVNGGSAPIS
jgi:hypothetical protein